MKCLTCGVMLLQPGNQCRNAATVKLRALRRFIESGRESLNLLRTKEKVGLDASFPDRLKNTISDTDTDQMAVILFHYSVHMQVSGGILPRLLSYSQIIQVFSAFGEIGCSVCEELARRTPSEGDFERLRREIFKSIRKYLQNRAGIQFDHWEKLRAYNAIRNCIVHRAGMMVTPTKSDGSSRRTRSVSMEFAFMTTVSSNRPERNVEAFLSLVEELLEKIFEQQKFSVG
jgi:hypothetical protein